jgi:hypothetical protein
MLADPALPFVAFGRRALYFAFSGTAPTMTRAHDITEPGAIPDTDPGPEPQLESVTAVIDPHHPPILNEEIAALLKGISASAVAHPAPKNVPVTDGQLTAKWAGEARDVQAARQTPEQQPRVLLDFTEETPLRELAANAVAPPRSVNATLIGVGASGAEASQVPEENVERAPNRATVLDLRKRRTGLAMIAVLAAVATVAAAAFLGRGRRERAEPMSPATRATASMMRPAPAASAAPLPSPSSVGVPAAASALATPKPVPIEPPARGASAPPQTPIRPASAPRAKTDTDQDPRAF